MSENFIFKSLVFILKNLNGQKDFDPIVTMAVLVRCAKTGA